MKKIIQFIALVLLAVSASAQQGQLASTYTSTPPAANATGLLLNRAVGFHNLIQWRRATVAEWLIGTDASNGGLVPGTVDGDLVVRSQNSQKLLFSFDNGATAHGTWNATGLAVTGTITGTGQFTQTVAAGDAVFRQSSVGGSGTDWFTTSRAAGTYTLSSATNANVYTASNTAHNFYSSNTLIAQVTASGFAVTGNLSNTFTGNTVNGHNLIDSADGSGAAFLSFRNSANTGIGGVTRVGTTAAVVYNTTSDGRLKTNIRDYTGADSGPIIDGLRPRYFDWKSGQCDAIGFIAQEENAVDPALSRIGAVTVGDDDPEVITKQWQRSDAALVPILVAELKSLRARVAALEALNTPASP